MLNIFNKLFYHTDRNINCYGRVSMWPDSTRDALLVEILCYRFKGIFRIVQRFSFAYKKFSKINILFKFCLINFFVRKFLFWNKIIKSHQ